MGIILSISKWFGKINRAMGIIYYGFVSGLVKSIELWGMAAGMKIAYSIN